MRRAIEGLTEELALGGLAERAFETEPGPANSVTTGLTAVINGYYDREMRARWGMDALLALLGLETLCHHLQAPPTLETLQARLDALHNTRPRRFSLLDHLFEKRGQDRC